MSSSPLSWSHLITVAVTTFVCTLSGLYIHRHLTSSTPSVTKDDKSDKVSKSKAKAIAFWEKAHCDKSVTNEWLADWSDLKPFVLCQLTKIMNASKKKKSDLKILILGNGLSEIPQHLYSEGFTNIKATDICSNAVDLMRRKYPNIEWLVVDCTQTRKYFEAISFDFVFEKGVSDTLQYRQRSKSSNPSLQSMFDQISQILDKKHGKFLCVSPRRKVPLLKLQKFGWSVRRMQLQQVEQKKFLYVHVCTKMNESNHLNVIKKQQNERRKQFEKSTLCELNALNLCFDPLLKIEDIERDIIAPFGHYENANREVMDESNGCRLCGIIQEIDSFFMLHGIVQFKRKFGKKLMFYRVSVVNESKKKTLQCIAERAFVAKLKNPLLKQEFATNYLTKCGDEVMLYGKLGLTNKGILSLFVYYVSLIQYHPNWKYE